MPLRACALVAALAAVGTAAAAQTAAPAAKADFIFDQRLRNEFVDQEGLADTAHALTLRTRLGWETPEISEFKLLAEFEHVEALVDDYNDTLNGQTRRPSVSDPETIEVNRFQLSWTGLPETEVVLGRQRITFDNNRFIGNSGWRQNEQTYDAGRVQNTAFHGWTLDYAYLDEVLRALGGDSPQGVWDSDSHLVHAARETPAGDLSLYSYLLDLGDSAPRQSNATTGVRLVGSKPAFGVKATYGFEYAHQRPYGSNPLEFELDYLALDAGLKGEVWSLAASAERMEGDGRVGLLTPLASSHGFQGWSDAIIAAPVNGLLDVNAKAAFDWKEAPIGRGLRFAGAVYHFADDTGQTTLGREVNASVGSKLTDHLSAEVKAAVFDGQVSSLADRTKVYGVLELKY